MKVVLRKSLRVFIWVIAALLILWIGVWAYVLLNKQNILAKISDGLNKRVMGLVTIGNITPHLFPFPSIELSNVIIRDSLYNKHHNDFLHTENLTLRINPLTVFTGVHINRVIIEKGSIYIFTDSEGNSSTYVLHSEETSERKAKTKLGGVLLKETTLVFDNRQKNKLHSVFVKNLKCDISERGEFSSYDINADMLVRQLAFNTLKGSFLKNKKVDGKFQLKMINAKKELQVTSKDLKLDNHPFDVTGTFYLASKPGQFNLLIKAKSIYYKKAASFVSENISKKLYQYDIEKPIDITASLIGIMKYRNTPLVNIQAMVTNSTVTSPAGSFTNCTFEATFMNEVVKGQLRDDANSALIFRSFSGNWETIPLASDSIKVIDLKKPFIDCNLRSEFDLASLNDLTGSNAIEITRGRAKMDIRFKGPITKDDDANASINGTINFRDAVINYLPRQFNMTNCDGNLNFKEQDVYIDKLNASVGKSRLLMDGSIKNLLSLINKSPEKLILDWNIASSKLDLNDFMSYIGKRNVAKSQKAGQAKLAAIVGKIDKMLQDCSAQLTVKAGNVSYKKFEASNVEANILLTENIIALRNVLLNHGGGTLEVSGSIREGEPNNFVEIKTQMTNLNIPKLFYSFENFGQDAVTNSNIKGKISADIHLTAKLTHKGELLGETMDGVVNLSVKQGELHNFEPMQKIQKFAFKNRDFTLIRFAELKDKLEIKGSSIKLNRMEIQSTVLTMFIEGTFDMKRGTDLSIQVPLSNLKKRDSTFELINEGIDSRTGVSLRLRAKTGENGKIKVSWDPFNKSLRKKDQDSIPALDSTSVTDSIPNRETIPSQDSISKRDSIPPRISAKSNSLIEMLKAPLVAIKTMTNVFGRLPDRFNYLGLIEEPRRKLIGSKFA